MKKSRSIFWVVTSAFLALNGATAAALAVGEVEPNYDSALPVPLSVAQPLTLDANLTATVSAFLSSSDVKGDVDVFSFQAKKGDKVTVDIDGGAPYIDTVVVLLGPGPSGLYEAKTLNDDSELASLDAGSLDWTDPYISAVQPYPVDLDGVYYIAVTHWGTQVIDNGAIVGGDPNPTGSYTVILSIARQVAETPPGDTQDPQTPAVQTVSIDIRPGQPVETATIHRSRARIPVAILSSDNFDATQVDASSLTFGRSGDEQSLEKCDPQGIDVNRDGRRDKVCLFNVKAANFALNDANGYLKGRTTADKPFVGQGLLKVIELRKGRGHRSDRGASEDHRRDDQGHKGRR